MRNFNCVILGALSAHLEHCLLSYNRYHPFRAFKILFFTAGRMIPKSPIRTLLSTFGIM